MENLKVSPDLEGLLHSLGRNTALAWGVFDLDTHIELLSTAAARLMLSGPPDQFIGRSLFDLFPPAWAEERASLLRAVHRDGCPHGIRSIARGKQIETTATPLPPGRLDSTPHFLVVTVEGAHSELDANLEVEVVESAFADLGPLGVLSRRELEVLALLKHGLSNREIGKRLFRSTKTIENHIGSISRKLHLSNRVQLALLAEVADLEVSDAQLCRLGSSIAPPVDRHSGRESA